MIVVFSGSFLLPQLLYSTVGWLLVVHWSVLRIHDILVWIRIRGSMPLTNGSECGSGSFHFHHWPSRCQQKNQCLLYLLNDIRILILIQEAQKHVDPVDPDPRHWYWLIVQEPRYLCTTPSMMRWRCTSSTGGGAAVPAPAGPPSTGLSSAPWIGLQALLTG